MKPSHTNTLRIGTRKSELAQWQANKVAKALENRGHSTELVRITSEGDQDQKTPLSEMGGKGVFTKALDDALLSGEIDMAVHSFKDLPTVQPLPLHVAAVLEREDPRDALVAPDGLDFLNDESTSNVTVATGSTRRKAQWLAKYAHHTITNLRGNVNTRLQKVHDNDWKGAIFAAAGLKRINLDAHISSYLDWMVPAPAQGAMAVMIRDDDQRMAKIVTPLNHLETEVCTSIERDLLHDLEAGCSAPVGAYAYKSGSVLKFRAVALEPDGSEKYEYESEESWSTCSNLGHRAADMLLEQGAAGIINSLND